VVKKTPVPASAIDGARPPKTTSTIGPIAVSGMQ